VFDIHRSPVDPDSGELNEKAAARYTEHLIDEFAESPEGKALAEQSGGVGSWVALMFEYAFHYIGAHLPKMTTRDMSEVLFELFPRKVSTDASSAPEIVAELRAFWQFLQRQYHLPAAAGIVDLLDGRAESRLRAELDNPANFGMAKSIFMQGRKAGFDMTTPEGLSEFMLVYNASLGAPPPPGMLEDFDDGDDQDEEAPPATSPPRRQMKAKKKKARKEQRQARKRNRK
jgi:hypothetical protein